MTSYYLYYDVGLNRRYVRDFTCPPTEGVMFTMSKAEARVFTGAEPVFLRELLSKEDVPQKQWFAKARWRADENLTYLGIGAYHGEADSFAIQKCESVTGHNTPEEAAAFLTTWLTKTSPARRSRWSDFCIVEEEVQ